MWPDRRILELLGIDLPILQAPMTGVQRSALAIAVSEAGGLGALPCSTLGPADIRADVAAIRAATDRPFNLNFTCHRTPAPDPARDAAWRRRLADYRAEFGLAAPSPRDAAGPLRAPFDDPQCALVEELRPPVVSFHFGLPDPALLARVRTTGAVILSSATTVDEARWLAAHGCHAILAQGLEAGGHRGMFRTDDLATQLGTGVLVPQIADAVSVPVIAAGGIADARGIAAAFHLGAAGVQLGTAYLLCPETTLSLAHRAALRAADGPTVLTDVFTGRPARGLVNRAVRELGPLAADAPAYPLASAALAPLRAAAEAAGRVDFTPLFAGQAVRLARELPAGELTRRLAADALARLTAPR
jgi:nitronate monooxygenase